MHTAQCPPEDLVLITPEMRAAGFEVASRAPVWDRDLVEQIFRAMYAARPRIAAVTGEPVMLHGSIAISASEAADMIERLERRLNTLTAQPQTVHSEAFGPLVWNGKHWERQIVESKPAAATFATLAEGTARAMVDAGYMPADHYAELAEQYGWRRS